MEAPTIAGTTGAAATATSEPWLQAIKNKLKATVEGNPAMKPPIFEPNFSAIIVEKTTYPPPTKNERTSLRINGSIVPKKTIIAKKKRCYLRFSSGFSEKTNSTPQSAGA